MTVTTSGIISQIHKSLKGEVSKASIKGIVQDFITQVRSGLVDKEVVRLERLGIFKVRTCAARKGRNPRTGEIVKIKARDRVYFKAAKSVRERVAKKDRAK
jgi:DNA-binding protein HU-beta